MWRPELLRASASAPPGLAERRGLGRPLPEQLSAEPTTSILACPGIPSGSVASPPRPEQESGTHPWSQDGQALQPPPRSRPGSPGPRVTGRPHFQGSLAEREQAGTSLQGPQGPMGATWGAREMTSCRDSIQACPWTPGLEPGRGTLREQRGLTQNFIPALPHEGDWAGPALLGGEN